MLMTLGPDMYHLLNIVKLGKVSVSLRVLSPFIEVGLLGLDQCTTKIQAWKESGRHFHVSSLTTTSAVGAFTELYALPLSLESIMNRFVPDLQKTQSFMCTWMHFCAFGRGSCY